MKISEFDYHLPEELIAQTPLQKRDTSRLMVLDRKKKTIEQLKAEFHAMMNAHKKLETFNVAIY